ncbi:uncharacterized protein [Diabrotica undecimpunctata]|uniref:uncharacterized protein n=1 Tax=Diabrotica undecimpunctata TaxID=50387 RepID=UPI003B631F0A
MSVGGVGFFINKQLAGNLKTVQSVSTRVTYATFKKKTRYYLKVIQAYAPTTEYTDEEIEVFYDDLSTAITNDRTHFTVICGDFNAKIGTKTGTSRKITALGNFGSQGAERPWATLF